MFMKKNLKPTNDTMEVYEFMEFELSGFKECE